MAENVLQILKLFHQGRVLLKQLPEKGFFTCFEKWVEQQDCWISSEKKYFEIE